VAIVFGKNMGATIQAVLDSLLAQTLKPLKILVVDDGSTDATKQILKRYLENYGDLVDVIHFPQRPYDLRRIPVLWNSALEHIEGLAKTPSYVLIGADDDLYPPNYAEYLSDCMDEDPAMTITSGSVYGVVWYRAKNPPPEGGGRMISMPFLKKLGMRFPTFYGYETWIVYKALQMGYRTKKFSEVSIVHARALGRVHGFKEWGLAMACADYHPLYVLFLAVFNIAFNWRIIPRMATLHMTLDCFRAFRRTDQKDFALKKWKDYDPEVVEWLRSKQIWLLGRALSKPIRFTANLLQRKNPVEEPDPKWRKDTPTSKRKSSNSAVTS
jgi:glycosyltransferase involved in cell wall biosynthesis